MTVSAPAVAAVQENDQGIGIGRVVVCGVVQDALHRVAPRALPADDFGVGQRLLFQPLVDVGQPDGIFDPAAGDFGGQDLGHRGGVACPYQGDGGAKRHE